MICKRKYILRIIIVFCGVSLPLCFSYLAYAFLLGPNFPSVAVDDTTEGTFVWSSPNNAVAEDAALATVTSGPSNGNVHSHYLKATGFNLSIPTNATILGVIAEIDRQEGGQPQTPHDAHIYLVKAGVIQTATTDKADTSTFWPSTLTYATYGSESDLWGNTLTPADVNNSGFGIAINITGNSSGGGSKYAGNIDAIRISISYTTPGHRTMSSNSYSVQSDSINFAGGLSSSASYALEDTAGEVDSGISTSTSYRLNAGYQQMLQSYIAMSPASNSTSTLSSINGLAGGSSMASSSWVVTTDDPAGYTVSVQASTAPAMKGDHGDDVADYVPVSGLSPDFNFTILNTQSAFGFSPYGVDTASRYFNDGASCSAGAFITMNICWDGFSTSSKVVTQGLNANQPVGATTTLVYKAQIGSARNQTSGSYSATITVTAVSL